MIWVAPRIGDNFVCLANRCVYYWKTCERTKHRCTFDISEPVDATDLKKDEPLSVSTGFYIWADSDALLARAERRVSLAIGTRGKGDDILLPVTLLDEVAGADAPPSCPHSERMQGCGQPWIVRKNDLLNRD